MTAPTPHDVVVVGDRLPDGTPLLTVSCVTCDYARIGDADGFGGTLSVGQITDAADRHQREVTG